MRDPENIPDKKEALSLLTAYCSREEHCVYDVIQKMKVYQLPEEWTDEFINFLKEQKYIDENRYCSAFVNDKLRFNKWGRIKISYALSQKRMPSLIIQNAINAIDGCEYQRILENELQKKEKSIKCIAAIEKKAKLYRFAVSRGFESELVLKLINKM